ncbi:hypothetical protein LTR28_000165, partial [Elasticomyces elasticus]
LPRTRRGRTAGRRWLRYMPARKSTQATRSFGFGSFVDGEGCLRGTGVRVEIARFRACGIRYTDKATRHDMPGQAI